MYQKIFSNNNEYYTPKYVVDFFFPYGFDYDPCTCRDKAFEFNVLHYDTIDTDGLLKDWTKYNRIWINPPFTLKYQFIKKAVDTYKKCNNTIFILIPTDFITTKKFQSIDCFYEFFIPNGRIHFENLDNIKKNCSFGSIIIKPSTYNLINFINFNMG